MKQVGTDGLKTAARNTVSKLLNESKLPHYPKQPIRCAQGQWIVDQLYNWMEYVSKHFDHKPEQVVPASFFPRLAADILSVGTKSAEDIIPLMRKYRVKDDFFATAKLLLYFLDESGEKLEQMQRIRCHNCNELGHVVSKIYLILF